MNVTPSKSYYEVARSTICFISTQLSPIIPIFLSPLPATRPAAEVDVVHVVVKMRDITCGAVVVSTAVTTAVNVVAVVGTTAAVFRGVLVG